MIAAGGTAFALFLTGMGVADAAPSVVNRATEAGISLGNTPSWDVCVSDWDGDGKDDFFASLHMKNAGALFTQNADDTFSRQLAGVIAPKVVVKGVHSGVDRHGCVMADFDRNGLTDMYATAGRYADNRYKIEAIDNELWMQTAPGVVKDMAIFAGVNEPCSRGRHPVAVDWNGDGWVDLFYGAQAERNQLDESCGTGGYNEQAKVFLNNGADLDGKWLGFRTAPEFDVKVSNIGLRFSLAWDYNRDGRPDLLAQTFANRSPQLKLNNGGTGFTTGPKLPAMNGAKVDDITGDGIEDLVFADNAGFAYRAGTATGISSSSVRLWNAPIDADGWNVAIGDANGDGVKDVYGQTTASSGTANPNDILLVSKASGGFQPFAVPPAGGDASDVEAIVVNGVAQFVVLNGGNGDKDMPGPVQLIAYRN